MRLALNISLIAARGMKQVPFGCYPANLNRSFMNELPPAELLESTHRFPGKFVFKAIGRSDGEFAENVVAAVRESLGLEFDPPYELRETPQGRHVSVTIEPWVENAPQALAVYQKIREVPGLVMLL
jgi:uncharacterized protein